MASLINMSGGSLRGKGLPYDAEIEYLESTGTQWIDTGIISMNVNDFEIVFDFIDGSRGGNVLIGPINVFNWYQRIILSNGLKCYISYSSNCYDIELGNNYKIVLNNGTFVLYDSSNQELYRCNLAGYSTGTSTLQLLKAAQYYGVYRIRKFYIKDTIDLIPVRVGTTGYLYDKVSGQLFGNQGTGSFILGNDI